MTKTKRNYTPKDFASKLAHVIEEAGEVMAAAGKTQRFGLCSYNPELPEKEREYNIHWLERELKDLKKAIEALESDSDFKYYSIECSQ